MKSLKYLGLIAIALLLTAAGNKYFEIAKQLEIFSNVYKHLNSYYVDEIDPKELVEKGIDAMIADLDPYNDYIPGEELENLRFQQTGEYGGIGSTVQRKGDYVTIISPYKGSPSDKAGIKAGDQFIVIEGQDAKGFSSDKAVSLLKGKPGTNVTVKMQRGDETFTRTLTRQRIRVNSVPYYGMYNNSVGYIKLTSFTEGAAKEVASALKELKKNHEIKGVLLDLQGNGGGLLDEAVDIVNVFVPKNELVVTLRGKDGKELEKDFTRGEPVDTTIPLAVVIDYNSVSASEIVAGALQDLDRAVIVGRNSYGKGLVQTTRPVAYNSQLKLTTGKYYLPSGRSIQRRNWWADKEESGKPAEVPDSLKTAHATKAGRTVWDGAGIEPDVETELERSSAIVAVLFYKNLLHDYSIEYYRANPTITGAREFSLNDIEYDAFVAWLADKDYSYKTKTERELAELKTAATDEKYSDLLNSYIVDLEQKVAQTKEKDLQLHKKQIKELLEREIANRYYYRAGRFANGLRENLDVREAAKVVVDTERYKKLLSGGA